MCRGLTRIWEGVRSMDAAAMVDVVARVGLPGVIAMYALVRLDNTLREMARQMAALTAQIAALMARRE